MYYYIDELGYDLLDIFIKKSVRNVFFSSFSLIIKANHVTLIRHFFSIQFNDIRNFILTTSCVRSECNIMTESGWSFLSDCEIRPICQRGPHCVSTVLAILTSKEPEDFQGKMNTQDSCTWSQMQQSYGMKLAYCPIDVRKLKFYMDELIEVNDLFTLSYYKALDPNVILSDPNRTGWITGSHSVILHRDKIIDSRLGVWVKWKSS